MVYIAEIIEIKILSEVILWYFLTQITSVYGHLDPRSVKIIEKNTTLPETKIAPENGWLEY